MTTQILPNIPKLRQQEIISPKDKSSYTYRLNLENKRIEGYCDRQDAMKQAIEKILLTQVYAYEIYSDQYGMELAGLIGKNQAYVESELKRRMKEALLTDERITRVYNFAFELGDSIDSLLVYFSVVTIFSTFDVRQEVGLV